MPKKRRTAQRPVSSDPKIRQIVDVVERLRGDDFERLGNDPLMWFACADGLLRAAEAVMCAALRQPGCLILPALMLRGFALEDLVRAVQLKRGEKLIENGKISLRGSRSHRLEELVPIVLGPLDGKKHHFDRMMLLTLTAAVRHSGRYPVPINAAETVVLRGSINEAAATWNGQKELALMRMVEALSREVLGSIESAMLRSWFGPEFFSPQDIPLPSGRWFVQRVIRQRE